MFPVSLLNKEEALHNTRPPPPFLKNAFLKNLLGSFEASQQKLKPLGVCNPDLMSKYFPKQILIHSGQFGDSAKTQITLVF